MKKKATHSLKLLLSDLFSQVYNDELSIPDAINQATTVIENYNDFNNNSGVEPLFDYGKVPLLNHYKIFNIKTGKTGEYKYFLYNEKQPDLSIWMFENELLDLLKDKQKNENNV